MSPIEAARVQRYLQQVFDNQKIRLMRRKNADDSVELMMGDEFLGTVYRDEDEGEISYQLNMAILEEDLPQD